VRCEKGKPVVRRGRKAQGPSVWEVAGLSNSSGGATKNSAFREKGRRRMSAEDEEGEILGGKFGHHEQT
jgi:hypothetical protein